MLMRLQPPGIISESARQQLAQLEAGAEQAHLGVGLADPQRLGGFKDG